MDKVQENPLNTLRLILSNELYDGIKLWEAMSQDSVLDEKEKDLLLKDVLIGSFLLGALAYRSYAERNGFNAELYESADRLVCTRKRANV